MQSGSSVVNGPVGGTMRFLCFDENTSVETFNGLKMMKNVKLGERLSSNLSTVTSVYSIDGTGIQMYSLGGILVTGSHKVMYKNKFIHVKDHPLAKLHTTGSKRLTCLNTTTHRIKIGNFDFLDFMECDDTDYMTFKHRYIEMLYNGTGKQYDEHTGVMGDTLIELSNNTRIMICNIKIGDVLQNGDIVKGICVHNLKFPHYSVVDGIAMSPNTWVYKNGNLYKAGDIGETAYAEIPQGVYQLITERSMYPVSSLHTNDLYVLDELETTEEFYHSMKDSIITTGRFRNKVIVV
jgi:hypothetical protein